MQTTSIKLITLSPCQQKQAEAIKIQTAAINAQGGQAYVQLKAIERWNGQLPTTMAGNSVPFINVK